MEHKLAYTEAKALCLIILTKYVFNVSIWLTEYSVTMQSVTLYIYICGCGFVLDVVTFLGSK